MHSTNSIAPAGGFEIWLIDPAGDSSPELVTSVSARSAAEAWRMEWERESIGLRCEIRQGDVVVPPAPELVTDEDYDDEFANADDLPELQFVVIADDDPDWSEPLSQFPQTRWGMRQMIEVALRLEQLPAGYRIKVREVSPGEAEGGDA